MKSLNTWYRLPDSKEKTEGMVEIEPSKAEFWNKRHLGIHWSIHTFDGSRRTSNLKRLNAFFIDIDTGTKDKQLERIKKGLTPSMITEGRRGHHVYWLIHGDLSPETYKEIVRNRLVPYYGADTNASLITQTARVPGFYNWKILNEPYLVKKVFVKSVKYSAEEMMFYYPIPEWKQREDYLEKIESDTHSSGNSFWERLWNLNCAEALQRLSGHHAVGGEEFSFQRTTNGKLNILVNGKSTSCWIDPAGRIGSLSKGGPSILNWLKYYGHNSAKCMQVLREVFPELFKGLDENGTET